MTADDSEPESEEDSATDEGRTVEDVDHEHPHTGETFDRTGVHGRGKEHPDSSDDATDAEYEESAEETSDAEAATDASTDEDES